MIRIAVIGTRGMPNLQGGVEQHCEHLYPEIAADGTVEIRLYCRAPFFAPDRRPASWRGVHLTYLPTLRRGGAEAFCHSLAATVMALGSRADILHYHNIGPAFFSPLAALARKKIVVTYHSRNYTHARWGRTARAVLVAGERAAVRFADRIIAVTPAHTRYLRHAYGERIASKLVCIANGVAPVDLPENVERRVLASYGIEAQHYVLAVGRLVEEKGIGSLVRAFRGVGDHSLRLVIAGDSDYQTAYARQLKCEAARDERIILAGSIDRERLWALYHHAALFVLPSHQEGMPLSLLEALYNQTPVLVSDIDATREWALPEDRYFVPGDEAGLREGLLRCRGRALPAEVQRRIHDELRTVYTWPRIAERTVRVYREILGSPPDNSW